MTKLAVVVGVSEYAGTPQNLPACANDASAMGAILQSDRRFDDILLLSAGSETVSSVAKNLISEFADKHRNEDIEELFFYFSGHGDFDGEDFSYIFSDFDVKRRNRTSLSNTELDGIFRSLSPNLFVKVVDACNSGISYIKNEGKLEDYLNSSNSKFNNVYFMFSSQSNESSYATQSISDFTKSFLRSVSGPENGPVRYRDIMSSISDDFDGLGGQTPLFVVQATNTEVFCETSDEIRSIVSRYVFRNSTDAPDGKKKLSLKDRILAAEENFATKKQAEDRLSKYLKYFENAKIKDDLKDLFEITVTAHGDEPHSSISIGKWISENKNEEIFARESTKTEIYNAPAYESALSSLTSVNRLLGIRDNAPEVKMVQKTRTVITGYRITSEDTPYKFISIKLNPKVKSIEPFECDFAPVLSRTKVVAFYRYRRFKYVDWEKVEMGVTTSWARISCPLNNMHENDRVMQLIWSGLCDFVEKYLVEKFSEEEEVPPKEAEATPDMKSE